MQLHFIKEVFKFLFGNHCFEHSEDYKTSGLDRLEQLGEKIVLNDRISVLRDFLAGKAVPGESLDFVIKLSTVLFLILFGIYLIKISSKESENYWLKDTRSRIKIFILAVVLIVSGITLVFKYFSL